MTINQSFYLFLLITLGLAISGYLSGLLIKRILKDPFKEANLRERVIIGLLITITSFFLIKLALNLFNLPDSEQETQIAGDFIVTLIMGLLSKSENKRALR